MDMGYWVLGLLAFLFLLATGLLVVASRYKRCPSDRILVVYGKVGAGQSARCIHGGGVLVWPLIQDYAFLSLTPMTMNIPLRNALSLQNIRIDVPSTFTVGVSTDPAIMNNAAVRLLRLSPQQIEEMGREIIFGQLRLTVASLTIEQINQDRESFLESIRKNVEPELNKVGLYLINVNITDITDESTYIESIGKKAASEAINRAKVDVAEQEKMGAIGQAEADREKEVRVAENVAESEKGKKRAEAQRRIFVQQQEAEAVQGEAVSQAEIAEYEAGLAVREAEAKQKGDVAKSRAEAEIQKARALAEQERLTAEEVVREQIERRKVEIAAEAEAERVRRVARGEADAILLKYQAEAEGVKQVLESKASGYRSLVDGCRGNAGAVATLLMTEKIEEIVATQVEAIKNIKIDKITVWDSANGDGEGNSTSRFMSGLIRSLPPLHEVAAMAGVDLPSYLGRISGASSESAGKPTDKAPRSGQQASPGREPGVTPSGRPSVNLETKAEDGAEPGLEPRVPPRPPIDSP